MTNQRNNIKAFLTLLICFATGLAVAQNATLESNARKLKEIQQRSEEIKIQQISDSLDEVQKSQQGGDIHKATMNISRATSEAIFGEQVMKESRQMQQYKDPNAENITDMNRNWLEKNLNYVIVGLLIFVSLLFFIKKKK